MRAALQFVAAAVAFATAVVAAPKAYSSAPGFHVEKTLDKRYGAVSYNGKTYGCWCKDTCKSPFREFKHVGCYDKSSDPNVWFLEWKSPYVPAHNVSKQNCFAECKGLGTRYAAIGGNGKECWCGNDLQGDPCSESKCDATCSGDPGTTVNAKCGGSYTFSVYKDTTFAVDIDKINLDTAAEGYVSYGCYWDDPERVVRFHKENSDNMSLSRCKSRCASFGYPWMMVQNKISCFCGGSLRDDAEVAGTPAACNTECSGEPGEMCGGWWAGSVYYNEDLDSKEPCGAPVTPEKVTTTKPPKTTKTKTTKTKTTKPPKTTAPPEEPENPEEPPEEPEEPKTTKTTTKKTSTKKTSKTTKPPKTTAPPEEPENPEEPPEEPEEPKTTKPPKTTGKTTKTTSKTTKPPKTTAPPEEPENPEEPPEEPEEPKTTKPPKTTGKTTKTTSKTTKPPKTTAPPEEPENPEEPPEEPETPDEEPPTICHMPEVPSNESKKYKGIAYPLGGIKAPSVSCHNDKAKFKEGFHFKLWAKPGSKCRFDYKRGTKEIRAACANACIEQSKICKTTYASKKVCKAKVCWETSVLATQCETQLKACMDSNTETSELIVKADKEWCKKFGDKPDVSGNGDDDMGYFRRRSFV